jgi:hypothetical protein
MAELRQAEAERLLEFVGDAHSVDGPEAFTTELLDRLAEAMKSEFVAYFEFDAESPAAPPLVPVFSSRLEHYVPPPWPYRPPQVPEFAFRPLGHVSLWSDDLQRAMRWRFETAPSARTFEVVDGASATIPASGSERGVVALFRQGRDFSERDRRALSALGPHLTALIRNARARRRLVDLAASQMPPTTRIGSRLHPPRAGSSRSSTPRSWPAESLPPGSTIRLVGCRRCSRSGCSQTSGANRSSSSATAHGSCSKHRHRRHSSLPRNGWLRRRCRRANEKSWAGLPPESRRRRLPESSGSRLRPSASTFTTSTGSSESRAAPGRSQRHRQEGSGSPTG